MPTYYERNRAKRLAYQKDYQKKRLSSDSEHVRSIKVKSVYGLTKEEWLKLVKEHGGKCAICKNEEKLQIDHCHQTKKVRGLLCARCNKAIGLFKDDIDRVISAVEYLKVSNGK